MHITLDTRPSHFSACNIENAGVAWGRGYKVVLYISQYEMNGVILHQDKELRGLMYTFMARFGELHELLHYALFYTKGLAIVKFINSQCILYIGMVHQIKHSPKFFAIP